EARRHVRVRGVLPAALRIEDEVRERHRLAELLHVDPGPRRHPARLQADPAAHRVPLRALRRTPGPRVRRRSAADGQALLQQRPRAGVRARGREAARPAVVMRSARIALAAFAAAGAVALLVAAETPEPKVEAQPGGHAVAIFSGGCFWCMEPPFDR